MRKPSSRANPRSFKASSPYSVVGARLKRLREAKGLSRRDLTEVLKVDVSSLVGWEAGKRLPRVRQRHILARLLGTDMESLFAETASVSAVPLAARLTDTIEDLPDILIGHLLKNPKRLCALRFAAPYPTAAYVQQELRTMLSERILADAIEVCRAEIFYDLRRLQETLSNMFRYAGHAYHVKSYCAGVEEVVPAIGGYFLDETEFLLGAYWTGMPPSDRPGLCLSGGPFSAFFAAYWNEIWRRGTLLNISGAHDLSAVQQIAFRLGLPKAKWKSFVEEARELQVGDGAPPLV